MQVRSVLIDADRTAILGRLRALTPDARRQWGRMNAAQMLRHTAAALRMALGDLPVKPLGMSKRVFHTRLTRYLMIRLLPFPKGTPTAPELRADDAADFEKEGSSLRELLARFATVTGTDVGPEHPLLGILSNREWGELQYKHLNHHFKQFGI